MEEDIKFIKNYMKQYFSEDISIEDDFKFEKAIENLIKAYKELELENQALKNNQANCPAMNTSGFKCNFKKLLEE